MDGTNFHIQRNTTTEREASLVVLGISSENCKSVLAVVNGSKDDSATWQQVFKDLKRRGLPTDAVRVGVMDGLPGLEKVFREEFPNSVTARCWVHATRNVYSKTPRRLLPVLQPRVREIMYASSESNARNALKSLKKELGKDCDKAIQCLEKDLESLLVHYRFEQRFWFALKTTNPIERVNRELKRRTRSMDSLGERTLQSVVAFTALRLEMNWRNCPVDSKQLATLRHMSDKKNQIEGALEELLH